jgi:hypothetical protein
VRSSLRTALTIAVLLSLALPGTSRAAITVGNTNNEGPGSLRQAVEDATSGETIIVPAGVYTLSSEIAIAKSLTISGHGAGDTIVTGGGSDRIFEVVGPNIDVTIGGLKIQGGGGVTSGGGIQNREEATLTVREVVVTNNDADADGEPGKMGGIAAGGGIFNQSGRLRVIDSSVTANRASAVGGTGNHGGISEGGGIGSFGPVTIEGSTIAGNIADASGGQGSSDPNQFAGISYGGGVYLEFEDADASVSTTTISDNLSNSSAGPGGFAGITEGGGLIAIAVGSDISLSGSTIAQNQSRGLGGKGRVDGGGLYYEAAGGGSMAVTSATIARNSVDQSLGEGGNVFLLGTVVPTIRDTIVSGGIGPPGTENCSIKASSLGFNLESSDECGFTAAGDQVNADPQLGPLQANGGPTATIAPASTSPAVDRGAGSGLAADQRGVQRPIEFPQIPNSAAPGGDGSDVGAFELQPASDLSLGKLQRNRKRGTATLIVTIPLPGNGTVTLSGKGLKSQSRPVADAATIALPVVGRGAVRKALRRRGKRKVGISVTYSPVGNSAVTRTRKAKLIRKLKRKKGKRH